MDHTHHVEYSPVDYDTLRESLNFSDETPEMTPERVLPNIGYGDGSSSSTLSALPGTIFQPFGDNFTQRTQVLLLPPCSPPKQIAFSAEMEPRNVQLKEYPAPLPKTGARQFSSLPPELAAEVGNTHPTFAQVRDFVGTSMMPLNTELVSLQKLVQDYGLTINGLQDVAIANQGMIFEKFQEVWNTLTKASTELANGHKENFNDLATFRM